MSPIVHWYGPEWCGNASVSASVNRADVTCKKCMRRMHAAQVDRENEAHRAVARQMASREFLGHGYLYVGSSPTVIRQPDGGVIVQAWLRVKGPCVGEPDARRIPDPDALTPSDQRDINAGAAQAEVEINAGMNP